MPFDTTPTEFIQQTIPTVDYNVFRAWLATKGDRFVGKRINSIFCPISLYYNEEHSLLVSVGETRICLYDEWISNPKWINEFVTKIDNSGTPHSKIKASTALSILNTIENSVA